MAYAEPLWKEMFVQHRRDDEGNRDHARSRHEPDPLIVKKVQKIALERPFYGTRSVGVTLSRELHVLRKQEEGSEGLSGSELNYSIDESKAFEGVRTVLSKRRSTMAEYLPFTSRRRNVCQES